LFKILLNDCYLKIKMSHQKLLIITADDFGYCPKRNLAIVELYQNRRISRTSLIMNGSYVSHAFNLVKQSDISIGLHFNLTEGGPLSGKESFQVLL